MNVLRLIFGDYFIFYFLSYIQNTLLRQEDNLDFVNFEYLLMLSHVKTEGFSSVPPIREDWRQSLRAVRQFSAFSGDSPWR
jgi:hypothetical protein